MGLGGGLGTGKEMVGKQWALGKNYHLHIIKVLLIFQRGLFFFLLFVNYWKKFGKHYLIPKKKERREMTDGGKKKKPLLPSMTIKI